MIKNKEDPFKIPVMSIHDTLLDIDRNPKLIKLCYWLDTLIKKERSNWGIKDIGYDIDYDLEAQWYPIFYFRNRWLANAFVKYVGRNY